MKDMRNKRGMNVRIEINDDQINGLKGLTKMKGDEPRPP